jgi:hypothetical protein
LRRGIGFEQHVGIPLSEKRIGQRSVLADLRLVLLELIDEKAVEKRRQERQHHYAKKHQWRIVDFKHFLPLVMAGPLRGPLVFSQ